MSAARPKTIGVPRVLPLLLSLAMAGGCKRCTTEDPPGPPPPKDLGDLEMVSTPEPEGLRQRWEPLTEGLEVGEGEAADLRYRDPPCPLRYQVLGEHHADVAQGRAPHGVVAVAEVTIRPGDDGWRLELESALGAVEVEGERGGKDLPADTWPATNLRKEEHALREIDGPSTLWAAHTPVPALTSVFFPLPESPEVGAAVGWKQRIYDRGQTAEAERRRARGEPAHPEAPDEVLASMTLARWITVAGEPAALLEGEWSLTRREIEPSESRKAERWRAQGVFLAAGWPLHYVAMGNVWRFVALTSDEGRHTTVKSVRALRLVEACEGPVLPRFEPLESSDKP